MKSQEEQWLLAEKYDGVKSEAFYADCKALALGEPLGYLIGTIPFLNCTIHLDNQPLIPRVETEYWVEQAIAAIKEQQSNQSNLFETNKATTTILDMCAGSGCIGVAAAKAVPDALVDFVELSERLLPTIQRNCAVNEIEATRYNLYHSNLFSKVPTNTKYDFILSNPPYIDPAVDRATDSVKSHEPHLALYGGTLGLEIIEKLIADAPQHLTPQGQLWIEHEPEQAAALSTIATERHFTCVTYPDQYGVLRYSVLVLQ